MMITIQGAEAPAGLRFSYGELQIDCEADLPEIAAWLQHVAERLSVLNHGLSDGSSETDRED